MNKFLFLALFWCLACPADDSPQHRNDQGNSPESSPAPGAIYIDGPRSGESSPTSNPAEPPPSAVDTYQKATQSIMDSLKTLSTDPQGTPKPTVKVEIPKIEMPKIEVPKESSVTQPAKSQTIGKNGEDLGKSSLTVDGGKIFRTGADGQTKDFKLVDLTVTDKNGKTIPPGTLTSQQVNKILGEGGKIGYPDGSC